MELHTHPSRISRDKADLLAHHVVETEADIPALTVSESAPLFLLTPVNITHHDWAGSTRTAPVQVVAWSSDNAKEIASRHYAKKLELTPGDKIVYQPWWNINLVRTQKIMRNNKWPVISQSDTPERFKT